MKRLAPRLIIAFDRMKTLRLLLVTLAALAAGVVASAAAQTATPVPGNANVGRAYAFSGANGSLLRTLTSPDPHKEGEFGNRLAAGDVDGDGKADTAVGTWKEDFSGGRVYVFAGADGALLYTFTSPNPESGWFFGLALSVGDTNGDGKGDIAVGAFDEDVGSNAWQGRAYVFSGANGSLLRTLNTPNPKAHAEFGKSVAVGDMNGDGKADIAVGADFEDVGGNQEQGRAYVFSGADGSLLRTLDTPNPQAYSYFGGSLAMADITADGKADIAVSAVGEQVGANADQGRAYVFSGANGSLLLTLDTPNPQAGASFARSVALGDVNTDAKADIAVGASGEDVGPNANQGRAYVFSGANGSLLLTLDSPNPQADADFGGSLAMGDTSGDGKADIAVGAGKEDVGANADQGRAYVFSGANGSLLFTLSTPNPQAGWWFGTQFGAQLAAGDVNGDGRVDITVGAPGEDMGGSVGGIAALPEVADSGWSVGTYAALTGGLVAAAALLALTAGAWYARRRWLR